MLILVAAAMLLALLVVAIGVGKVLKRSSASGAVLAVQPSPGELIAFDEVVATPPAASPALEVA